MSKGLGVFLILLIVSFVCVPPALDDGLADLSDDNVEIFNSVSIGQHFSVSSEPVFFESTPELGCDLKSFFQASVRQWGLRIETPVHTLILSRITSVLLPRSFPA